MAKLKEKFNKSIIYYKKECHIVLYLAKSENIYYFCKKVLEAKRILLELETEKS